MVTSSSPVEPPTRRRSPRVAPVRPLLPPKAIQARREALSAAWDDPQVRDLVVAILSDTSVCISLVLAAQGTVPSPALLTLVDALAGDRFVGKAAGQVQEGWKNDHPTLWAAWLAEGTV